MVSQLNDLLQNLPEEKSFLFFGITVTLHKIVRNMQYVKFNIVFKRSSLRVFNWPNEVFYMLDLWEALRGTL